MSTLGQLRNGVLFVREETQDNICTICKKPITQQDWPCKGLPNGKRAHLACYIDHMHDDEKKPSSP